MRTLFDYDTRGAQTIRAIDANKNNSINSSDPQRKVVRTVTASHEVIDVWVPDAGSGSLKKQTEIKTTHGGMTTTITEWPGTSAQRISTRAKVVTNAAAGDWKLTETNPDNSYGITEYKKSQLHPRASL